MNFSFIRTLGYYIGGMWSIVGTTRLLLIVVIVMLSLSVDYVQAAELSEQCQDLAGEETGSHLDYTQTGVILVCNQEEAAIEFGKNQYIYHETLSNLNGSQVCNYHGWCDFGGYAVYSGYPSPYVYSLILRCGTDSYNIT